MAKSAEMPLFRVVYRRTFPQTAKCCMQNRTVRLVFESTLLTRLSIKRAALMHDTLSLRRSEDFDLSKNAERSKSVSRY